MTKPTAFFGAPLLPGKAVLWAGQPCHGTRLWQMDPQETGLALASVSAAIAIVAVAATSDRLSLDMQLSLFGFAAVLAALAPVLAVLRRGCLTARRYAFTTRRALVWTGRGLHEAPIRPDYPYSITGKGPAARLVVGSVFSAIPGALNRTGLGYLAFFGGLYPLAFERLSDPEAALTAVQVAQAKRGADA